jgi:hypothetical protein
MKSNIIRFDINDENQQHQTFLHPCKRNHKRTFIINKLSYTRAREIIRETLIKTFLPFL